MNTLPRPHPLVVIILDGWGISFKYQGNAIAAAETPTMDTFSRQFPSASLTASGTEVGLPPGIAGNSETGHRNIGAGRVEYQIMASIDLAIRSGSFYQNKTLLTAIEHARTNQSNLHLIGLASSGGVHSHLNHLFAILALLAKQSFKKNVYIHLITDGQDTPPHSSLLYLRQIEKAIKRYRVGKIASVVGRYYAMDRNNNWDRTKEAFDLLTGKIRLTGIATAKQAIELAYERNIPDERIPGTVLTTGGRAIAKISDNDAVIFFNFRPDRARQLTQAFVTPQQAGFAAAPPKNLYFATLTQYDENLPAPYAVKEESAEFPLARLISDAGLTQQHIAETEKYAHITYYLNVGHEKPFPNEDHTLIRSSSIRNFAEKPQMEAYRITYHLIEQLKQDKYDVYFVNFANADMVGHTGNYDATKNACTTVDLCLAKIFQQVIQAQGAIVLTADHGKAEEVNQPSIGKAASTQHTKNPVPFHYIREELRRTIPKSDHEVKTILSNPIGVLADVAPTILDILQLPKPPTMTGISLLGSLR